MERTETNSEILLGDPDGDDRQPAPIGIEPEREEQRILRPLFIEP